MFRLLPRLFVIHVWLHWHAHDLSPQAHHYACITYIAPKNMHRCNVGALPFWLTLPGTCKKHVTWLAPARFRNWSFPEPHNRQAPSQTPPLLEEPTRIGAGTSEGAGMCLKHGALAGSHGTHWLDHMEPMSHHRRSNCLTRFITYHGTTPMPTS